MSKVALAHLSLTCLVIINLIPFGNVGGCVPTSSTAGRQQRSHQLVQGRIYQFLTLDDVARRRGRPSESFAITKGVYVTDREPVYGRIDVPYETSGGGFVLTLGAHWKRYGGEKFNSPVWMYIRKNDLPSTSNWDRKSVSFVTRGYARIQVDTPTPGVYYVMIRTASPSATDDDDDREGSEEDLTVVTSILPRDHPEAGNPSWRLPSTRRLPRGDYYKTSGKVLRLDLQDSHSDHDDRSTVSVP